MICDKDDSRSSENLVSCLKSGGIAIVPTDTVYGFSGAVDLKNKEIHRTDEKIRKIKGRAETKPFIQLISAPEDIKYFTDKPIPDQLLKKWPGPLTVIVNIKKDSPFAVSVPTVAFRCPGDFWLRDVIQKVGSPIFSTSVNRSGKPVIDEISAIEKEFSRDCDLIVRDGDKKGAVPSTIVSVTDGAIKIIRQGSLVI